MDRLRAWGLSAALASGVGVPSVSAIDPPMAPGDTKPWYTRILPGSAKAPLPPKEPRPVPTGPLSPETLAESLRAEQDAYLRRLDVCTKLRQVAIETNNEQLLAQADGLEQQATTLYHQRTARLGVRGGPKGSFNSTAVASQAETTLNNSLGSGNSVNPLTANRPAADSKPATAQARQWKVVPE